MAQAKKTAKTGSTSAKVDKTAPEKDQVVEDAIVLNSEPPRQKSDNVAVAPAGRSFVPMVIGGVVAGAIGFGAATYLQNTRAPVVADNSAAEKLIADLSAQSAALESEIAALKSQIGTLQQVVSDGPNAAVINGLGKRQDQADRLGTAQAETLTTLEDRLNAIENRPAPVAGEDPENGAAMEQELATVRQFIATELSRIEAAQEELRLAQDEVAQEPENNSTALAISTIAQAVNTGAPFHAALADLGEGVSIPDGLAQAATEGVVTLSELQAKFPDAARAALNSAIRAEAEQGETNRLAAFLRIQLGARSLTPKDGDNADAILSRAEAALKTGDISTAIGEIDNLSVAGAEQMADWVELARSRLVVVDALAELTAAVGN